MVQSLSLLRFMALSSTLALLSTACGGSVDAGFDSPPLPDAGDLDASPDGGETDAGSPIPDGGKEPDRPGEYEDPDCPDTPLEPPYLECDPLAEGSTGCAVGEACHPFVRYPESECEQESYGAICMPEGTGTQGSPCGSGESSCKGGFVCVISGAGVQCVKLCDLDTIASCPDGLVCEPLDVEGFGGCL